MHALRMLGLVALAGICISIFVVAYQSFQGLSREERARGAALELHSKIQHVINTGDPRTVDIEVPGGYVLSLEENQLVINGIRMPEGGYSIPMVGNNLTAGEHRLSVALENGEIVVSEVS